MKTLRFVAYHLPARTGREATAAGSTPVIPRPPVGQVVGSARKPQTSSRGASSSRKPRSHSRRARRGTRRRRASARARRGAGRRRAARSACASGRPGPSRRGSAGRRRLAICGRCVIVTTCARSARRRSVSATAWAVVPPMPASISSNTIVSPPATAAIASAIARQFAARRRLRDRAERQARRSAGSGT